MMSKWYFRLALLISLLPMAGSVLAMASLQDDELGEVTGQALLVVENIKGSNITSGLGQGDWSSYTYTRMGLDAKLSLNANIDKWQMGCGGFNSVITSANCDIDMDFVRFMGRSGTEPCSVSTVVGDPCYGGGELVLTRPYVEIATKGDGVEREVVGIKIGAQNASGYFGVGRTYANGETNTENGGTCGSAAGSAALACHSGINSISGYMHVEMSGSMPVTVTVIGIPSSSTACFGQTTIDSDCSASNTSKLYRDIVGTRQTSIVANSIPLKLNGGLAGIIGSGYAALTENLRFIHGFALEDTADFGLSFQRQKLAYPGYLKTAASYSFPANAGWWMNVPDVKAKDIRGAGLTKSLSEAISSFSEPGLPLSNIELNSKAPKNCWGNSLFC